VFRFSSRSRIAIALLCAALVASRLTGAHFHLCADGSEPPMALHVIDTVEHHHGELADVAHEDMDVDAGTDYLSKKLGAAGLDSGALAFLFFLLLFFVPRLRSRLPDLLIAPRAADSRVHWLPPPRGPPRLV
jgi:hypothetical protein